MSREHDRAAAGPNPRDRVPVPLAGHRCPRCRQRAPRADGIPCELCAPGDTSPEAAAERHRERVAVLAPLAKLYTDPIVAAYAGPSRLLDIAPELEDDDREPHDADAVRLFRSGYLP